MKKKISAIAVGALVLLLAAAFAVYIDLKEFARTAASPGSEEQVLTVASGQPLAATAEELQRRQLVQSAFKFRMLAGWKATTGAEAGEYSLKPSMTPRDILALMEKGTVRLHRLTIPEGLTLAQIAEQIEKSGLAAADILMRPWTRLLRAQGIDAPSLEGYLFPETYFFPRTITAEGIIAAMLQAFRSAFPRSGSGGRRSSASPCTRR